MVSSDRKLIRLLKRVVKESDKVVKEFMRTLNVADMNTGKLFNLRKRFSERALERISRDMETFGVINEQMLNVFAMVKVFNHSIRVLEQIL